MLSNCLEKDVIYFNLILTKVYNFFTTNFFMFFTIHFRNYNDTFNIVSILFHNYICLFIFTHFNKAMIVFILFNMYTR